jgi:hypothetical protein
MEFIFEDSHPGLGTAIGFVIRNLREAALKTSGAGIRTAV